MNNLASVSNIAKNDPITLSVITSIQPQTLTKTIKVNDAGELISGTSANMTHGHAKKHQVHSAQQFADLLKTLNTNQALAYGVTKEDEAVLLSRKEYAKQGCPNEAITRTKENMHWPTGAGVLMIDYDPDDGATALSKEQLYKNISEVLPNINDVANVWWCSSSSLIYNGMNPLSGIKGQRIYLMVDDAADIERAGKVLFSRLWLAGYGYYKISRAAQLLERTVVDSSVWQTNRLDFAAGALCVAPLEQRRGDPIATEGALLDTKAALLDLSAEEKQKLNAIKESKKADVAPYIKEIRERYIETEATKLIKNSGDELNDETLEQARGTIKRALNNNVLSGEFIIYFSDGEQATVREILENPERYANRQTLDPLEPEYNNKKVVGVILFNNRGVILVSQAHGKKVYKLIRQPLQIDHNNGETASTVNLTLNHLRKLSDVFDMNGKLVVIHEGKAVTQDINSLGYWLAGVIQYWGFNSKGDHKRKDPPPLLLKQILAIGEQRQLKKLSAVITAPVITKDGRVIDQAGYDEETQLYLDMPEAPPKVASNITPEQTKAALETIMQPFKNFAFNAPIDRAVCLAALLTAIQRPILPTAPAIGIDAPVQGTGKTYLAECIAMLSIGSHAAAFPHTKNRDDDEVRKRLTSILMTDARALIWDNIIGNFDSAAMAALLTSPIYSDRLLGESTITTAVNKLLVLLTGNNLTLAGDMPRRVLMLRLDAMMANPATRKFDNNPLSDIKENRQQLVHAGLTLIRAYQESDDYKNGGTVNDESTSSFEMWDSMVRQTVAWISKNFDSVNYADPADALKTAMAKDPELDALTEALELIEQLVGNGIFTSRELFKIIDGVNGGVAGELRLLIEDITGNNNVTSRGLGRVLAYRVGRFAGGRRLVRWEGSNVVRFQIDKV